MEKFLRLMACCLLFCFQDLTESTESSYFSETDNLNGKSPSFTKDLPDIVEFSNTIGVELQCQANGNPEPKTAWISSDGYQITDVPNLRLITSNTLTFSPFKAEDYRQDVHASQYQCTATNDYGTLISKTVQVKAVISQSYDVHVYDAYVIKGNSAVLKCHVPLFLAKYVKVVSWMRDDRYVINNTDFNTDFKYVVLTEGDLLIRDAEPDDHGAKFNCHTVHRLTKNMKLSSTHGKLFVTEPQTNVPPRFVKTDSIIKVNEQTPVRIPCIAQGYPIPKIKWYRKEENGKLTEMNDYTTKETLILPSIKKQEEGPYVCVVNNTLSTQQMEVQVNVIAPLKAVVSPKIIMADVGKPIHLSCTPSGFPIKTITWLKDGKPIDTYTIKNLSSEHLSIDTVLPTHKGLYQCFVANDEISAYDTCVVKLGDSPPEFTSVFNDQVLLPGSSLSLKCSASGTPLPTLTWLLDGTEVRNTMSEKINEESIQSVLNKSSIKTEDGGVYTCISLNKAGSVQHSSRIDIEGPLKSRPLTRVTAVAGTTILLNCPVYGYPIHSFEWKRGKAAIPQHHRQKLSVNGSLSIKNVQKISDNGNYDCIAKQNSGQTAKGKILLSVLLPPKITPFYFQDDLVREGMRARIQCVISEGDLPLTIQWTKDQKVISFNNGIVTKDIDEYSSILTISSVSPRHNGNYTCTATNAATSVSHTAQLSVNVAPKITPFSFQEESSLDGAFARVTCLVYQGDLPISLQWLKDGHHVDHLLHFKPEVRTVDEYSSSLTIANVARGHSGNYTCVASNEAARVVHTATLTVHVPPKIVPFTIQDDHLMEGMLVRISCVAGRGDLPLNITWLKDGQMIPSDHLVTVRKFDEYSSVLSIDPVKKIHSGNYTCTICNHAGFASHTAPLIVYVPPRWITEPPDQKIAMKSTSLMIDCEADGFPHPQIQWKKDKDLYVDDDDEDIPTGIDKTIYANGSLHFWNLKSEDEGLYICFASNEIGEPISKTVSVHVQAPVYFKKPNITQRSKIGSTSTLKCLPQGDTPIKFMWKRNEKIIESNNKFEIVAEEKNEQTGEKLMIRQITAIDKGEYTCFASNVYGNATAIFNLIVQELPHAPEKVTLKYLGNRSIELSWKVSFDGHSPILQYKIQHKKKQDSWTSRTISTVTDAFTSSLIIKDLQPAATYMFRVAAINDVGTGNSSDIIEVEMEEEAPEGVPQQIEIESVDPQTMRISWKPPKKNSWNGAIRGYNIGYREYNSTSPYKFDSIEVPEDYTEDIIYQMKNLQMFTKYSIVIQAYNKGGNGPTSDESVVMTSENAPSQPPSDIRCSALSSRSIYVVWDSPVPNSVHGILRGYKVIYKNQENWNYELNMFNTTDSTKITLNNLNSNSNYSIAVLAFTRFGEGVKSNPIFCKTHEDVPESPEAIKALPASEESVLVAWKEPPNSNGGISKYNLYYTLLNDGQEFKDVQEKNKKVGVNVKTLDGNFKHYEVKGLQKDTRYAFWVSAISSIGEGPVASVIAQIPSSVEIPAQVASFDTTIKSKWKNTINLPCKGVGIPTPTRQWITRGKPVEENDKTVVRFDGTLVLKDVNQEDTSNYSCIMTNQRGQDQVLYSVIVLVPPGAPLVDILSKSLSSINLSWKTSSDGGEAIQGFIVNYKREKENWQKVEIPSSTNSYTLNNLSCGINYQIYVECFNSVGNGYPSETITVSTQGELFQLPDKEQLIQEGATFATIHLNAWSAGGCPIRKFSLEYQPVSSNANEWIQASDDIRPTQKKFIISSLDPATWYVVRLTAYTSNQDFNAGEYVFSTKSLNGGNVPPHIRRKEEKVVLFYLDPWIFIPIVILVILCIIVSVLVFVYCKCKAPKPPTDWTQYAGTLRTSVDMGMTDDSYFPGTKHILNRPANYRDNESALYATIRPNDYYSESTIRRQRHHPNQQQVNANVGQAWIPMMADNAAAGTNVMNERPNTANQETAFIYKDDIPTTGGNPFQA